MTLYELAFEGEILMEKGADVMGDLFRYSKSLPAGEDRTVLTVLSDLVWGAKRDVLMAKTEKELAMIEGKFDLVRDCLQKLEERANA